MNKEKNQFELERDAAIERIKSGKNLPLEFYLDWKYKITPPPSSLPKLKKTK